MLSAFLFKVLINGFKTNSQPNTLLLKFVIDRQECSGCLGSEFIINSLSMFHT